MAEKEEPIRNWYALRVFHNRSAEVRARVEQSGGECFVPMQTVERNIGYQTVKVLRRVIPSLLFVRAAKEYVERIRKDPKNHTAAYCAPGTKEPAVIPDREMNVFIFVTTADSRNLEPVDPALAKGDRVRVTGGPFKGAEGYIVRVKNTKRFIVSIEGVAAVATGYIPKNFIEKIDDLTVAKGTKN